MAKRLKHKKLKNTGLLYEFLLRQITSDILQGKAPVSLNVIRKHFKNGTPLQEELQLYNMLLSKKVSDTSLAVRFIDAAISSRNSLNLQELNKQKYHLIKDISKLYEEKDLFRTRVENYPMYASIGILFENKEVDNLIEYTDKKVRLSEFLLKENTAPKTEEVSTTLENIDPELRSIVVRVLIEKINKKWDNLHSNQKRVLRHYLYNLSNVNSTDFLKEEVSNIRKELTAVKTTEPVLEAKIKELLNLLQPLENITVVEESHYLLMLRYYELINELNG